MYRVNSIGSQLRTEGRVSSETLSCRSGGRGWGLSPTVQFVQNPLYILHHLLILVTGFGCKFADLMMITVHRNLYLVMDECRGPWY